MHSYSQHCHLVCVLLYVGGSFRRTIFRQIRKRSKAEQRTRGGGKDETRVRRRGDKEGFQRGRSTANLEVVRLFSSKKELFLYLSDRHFLLDDGKKMMEIELKKMYDIVLSIHDEMFYLREREEEMQELNRSTHSKMAWLSFCSLFVCLSVAGLQLMHLKTFFEKKKLI